MTEQEVLTQQEASGNTEFFMILIGRFLHAYGNGAFALARITGYHVRRQQRKAGEVLVLGFPIDRLEYVRDKIRDAGGDVESVDAKTWMFRGVDGTPDEQMVSDPRQTEKPQQAEPPQTTMAASVTTGLPTSHADANWLEDAVRSFDLSTVTPIDAMIFLSSLKQRLLRQGQ